MTSDKNVRLKNKIQNLKTLTPELGAKYHQKMYVLVKKSV